MGVDVARQPDRVRRMIGLVGQHGAVDSEATGRENLVLQGHLYGMGGALLKRRVDELLARFGLADAAGRIVKTWSGGMQRKLDVASGLIHQPQVLFLDEPTTGLDPEARADLWAEVLRLAAEGLTILLTTHYLEEADRLAGQVAIIDRGRIVARGTPDELKSELRGDAIVVELRDSARNEHASGVLELLDGVHEPVAFRSHAARPRRRRSTVGAHRSRRSRRGGSWGGLGDGRPSDGPSTMSISDTPVGRIARRARRQLDDRSCPDPLPDHPPPALLPAPTLVHRDLLVQPVIWLLLFGALFRTSSRSRDLRLGPATSTIWCPACSS